MKELIEFMARAIVENPDAVEVTEEMDGEQYVYYLKVADEDMGRVIGKQGRIANAMRTMLKVAAIRRGVRAVLEIGDMRGGRAGSRSRGYRDRDDDYDHDAEYDEPPTDGGNEDEGAQHEDALVEHREDEPEYQ